MTDLTETVLHDPAVQAAIEEAEARLKAAQSTVDAKAQPAPEVQDAKPGPAPEPKPVEAKIVTELPTPRVQHPTTTPPAGYNSRIVS